MERRRIGNGTRMPRANEIDSVAVQDAECRC